MKDLISPSAIEALYPQQLVKKYIAPSQSVPALLHAGDLLGLTDAERARALSAMGDPSDSLSPGKTRKITRSMVQEWRTGRRPIPVWHRARLAAYLEFGSQELARLALIAHEPASAPIWSALAEVKQIVAKELEDPAVRKAVEEYRKGFERVFHETKDGRFFLLQQEKRVLELTGKKH
jgi:hypothetical protein